MIDACGTWLFGTTIIPSFVARAWHVLCGLTQSLRLVCCAVCVCTGHQVLPCDHTMATHETLFAAPPHSPAICWRASDHGTITLRIAFSTSRYGAGQWWPRGIRACSCRRADHKPPCTTQHEPGIPAYVWCSPPFMVALATPCVYTCLLWVLLPSPSRPQVNTSRRQQHRRRNHSRGPGRRAS